MIQHLDFRVTSLLNEVAKLKDEALEYARNKDNPFALRWDAFKQFARLGGCHDSSIYHGWDDIRLFPSTNWRGETTNDLKWYNDFGIERYATLDLLGWGLESLLDRLWYTDSVEVSELNAAYETYESSTLEPLNPIDWALTVYKEPVLIQAVEALMRDGVTRFTYDW